MKDNDWLNDLTKQAEADQANAAWQQFAGTMREYYKALVVNGFSNEQATLLTLQAQNTILTELFRRKE